MAIIVLVVGLVHGFLLAAHLFFDVDVVEGGLLALVELHVRELGAGAGGEDGLQNLALVQGQRVGELHGEVDIQLAPHERPLVHGHSFVVYPLELICRVPPLHLINYLNHSPPSFISEFGWGERDRERIGFYVSTEREKMKREREGRGFFFPGGAGRRENRRK